MEREIAYTLSDVFVQKIDDCKTVAEIAALHNIMVRDFTKRMQLLQKAAYSMHVARAIDYITIHLHEKLQTGNIADADLDQPRLSFHIVPAGNRKVTSRLYPCGKNPCRSSDDHHFGNVIL